MTKPDETTSGVSRRAVVRTGAHAAWAVPAISLATAAPAMAVAQTGKSRVTASFNSGPSRSGSTVTWQSTIANLAAATASTADLKLEVKVEGVNASDNQKNCTMVLNAVQAGLWNGGVTTVTNSAPSGAKYSLFVLTASTPLLAGTSQQFNVNGGVASPTAVLTLQQSSAVKVTITPTVTNSFAGYPVAATGTTA